MSDLITRFVALYQQLDRHNLQRLDEVYAPEVQFVDPAHRIDGREALRHYFAGLYANVSDCRFSIEGVDEGEGVAWIRWTMTLSHPRLQAGQPFAVEGASQLRFNERIYWHRDYFDLGALFYERLPLLGALIRGLKRRLST